MSEYGRLVGSGLVGLGPLGADGAQQQPRHNALAGTQGGQGADDGDQGVGAGVQQVVVPEGAQGHVVGTAGTQAHRPRLLAVAHHQRVAFRRHLADARLGVVGGHLAAHHPVVLAAGHERHAVAGTGQFQGEGFGDGDGLEQVLHSQQGALSGPGRRHRQQNRGLPALLLAEDDLLQVQFHIVFLL